MKLIIAVIRPEKLTAVQQAIDQESACLLSVSQVLGNARESGYTEIYRGRQVQVQRPKLRVEIAVDDVFVDSVVDAIVRAASTAGPGQLGDGKVFVVQMDECIPIGMAEQGQMALGR